MKRSEEEALRWLKQSAHNLEVAENNLKGKFYSDVCFMSEQSAQLSLKAYLILKTGRHVVWEHSIQSLAKKCVEYDEGFKEIIEYGRILDRYYIPTRYPDALTPPALPYETYIETDALEAIGFSRKIFEKVKKEIEAGKN